MFIKYYSRSIFLQIVIGLVVSVICGVSIPDLAVQTKPLGDGFIELIKMLIALIVFCVVVNGISGAGGLKKVGRIGPKPVIYFEILTIIVLVLGPVVAYSLGLDSGTNIHLNELPAGDVTLYIGHTQEIHDPVAFLMGLIPISVFSALTENNIFQVLLFSVLSSDALSLVNKQANDVTRLINEFSHIVFCTMDMIVRLAPLGVFGAVAFTTVRYSVNSLGHLGTLVLVFYATRLVFVMATFSSVLHLSGVHTLPFLRHFREELVITVGTASSDAILSQVMRKLEHVGIRSSTVGLVVSIGYSFSLNGFSIYPTLVVVFIAHVTDTPLAIVNLVTILPVSLITSKGAHGAPGPVLTILAATLTAVPAIPVTGLVLMFSVDWFMGVDHALANLIGNCVTTMTIVRQENDIDVPRAQAIPDGRLGASAKTDGEPLRRSAVAGEGKLHDRRAEARCMSDWQVRGGDMFSSSKLVNAVAQCLLGTIEQGRWVAGRMLPGQHKLTKQMEINRPSLREVIMVLRTLGMVRSLSGKGVMALERSEPLCGVTTPGEMTMESVLQLRYTLGPLIVGTVVQSAGAVEISELQLLLLDLREAVEDGDPQALVETYTAFHRCLVKLVSNPIFLSVSEQIGSALERNGSLVHCQPGYTEETLQGHDVILCVIRQYNSERANQVMCQHILNGGACLNINLCSPQV